MPTTTKFWTFSQKNKMFQPARYVKSDNFAKVLDKQCMSFPINNSASPNKYSLLYLLSLGKQTSKKPEF